ncbi:MAG TPA: hypothetical protein VN541_23640, partial [Tepidisphaeraceae bacterium]|nr:hypothetical protein [Tepidisphaeraceae bacterium]
VDTPIRPVPILGGVSSGAPVATGGSSAPTTPTDPVLREHAVLTARSVRHKAGMPFSGDVGILSGVATTSAHPSNLQGTINWGDGTTAAATFVRDHKGRIHVRGKHTYVLGGSDTITLSLTQSLASRATADPPIHFPLAQSTAQITGRQAVVHDRPTPALIHATAGHAFDASVGTFSGQAPVAGSTFQATIAWGDGSHSLGTVLPLDSSDWEVAGSHTYAKKGTHAARVLVTLIPVAGKPIIASRWTSRALVTASAP